MRFRTSRNRNNKYILAKFDSKAEPQPQQDTNSQQNSQKKYIVPKFQMETKIDLITNLSIKVI